MLWQNKCFVFNFFTFPRHPPISSNIFIWKTLFDIINHWELQKSQTSLDRFTCDIHLVKMLLGKSVVIYVLENILKLHLNVVHYSVQGYSGCWIHTSEMEVAPSEAISVHLSFCSGANELRNSASSFHWLSSSIFNVCLFVVCPASVTPPLISTIWCFRPYKPYIFSEYMILATCQCQHILIAELSPVYCCLVFVLL